MRDARNWIKKNESIAALISGVISAKSSSMHLEDTRRAIAGTAVYMPLARTVIAKQAIERSTRQAMARSLVFSVLLSGARTWPQLTAASAKRIRAAFFFFSGHVNFLC